jgi:uncharacterized protein (TIGR02145 family)
VRTIPALAFILGFGLITSLYSCLTDSDPVDIDLPTITTSKIDNIAVTGAYSGGIITSTGGAPITESGLCWSKDTLPTIHDDHTSGTDTSSFTDEMSNLEAGTVYFVRAYATNSSGTGYGEVVYFATSAQDVDGNIYHTVIIGHQLWMLENLRATRYKNGDPLYKALNRSDWSIRNNSAGAYCSYNYDDTNAPVYGMLYNSMATIDTRDICPEGWHLPTMEDWHELRDHLGGNEVAGGKMKEAGTDHWLTLTDASNSSGFTGLPAGSCHYDEFSGMGTHTYFWSNPDEETTVALLTEYESLVYMPNNPPTTGMSIRCIRDFYLK